MWKKGNDGYLCLATTGPEETIQSHFGRDVSLLLASPWHRQLHFLYCRAGDDLLFDLLSSSHSEHLKHWEHNEFILRRNHTVLPPLSSQVSHHPPISAFYVSNKKDGFCITGSIFAKSKFYGKQTVFFSVFKLYFHCFNLFEASVTAVLWLLFFFRQLVVSCARWFSQAAVP